MTFCWPSLLADQSGAKKDGQLQANPSSVYTLYRHYNDYISFSQCRHVEYTRSEFQSWGVGFFAAASTAFLICLGDRPFSGVFFRFFGSLPFFFGLFFLGVPQTASCEEDILTGFSSPSESEFSLLLSLLLLAGAWSAAGLSSSPFSSAFASLWWQVHGCGKYPPKLEPVQRNQYD